jgi:phosphoribosylformylglycinamidine cyclo-ligase
MEQELNLLWHICTGKKTGDISVWKGIAQEALIMNIDDLLCVNDWLFAFFTLVETKNLIRM